MSINNWNAFLKKVCAFVLLFGGFLTVAVAASETAPAAALAASEAVSASGPRPREFKKLGMYPWSCWGFQGDVCKGEDWPDLATTKDRLKLLYYLNHQLKNFAMLERALKELSGSDKNFPTGEPLSSAPGFAFRQIFLTPGAGEPERLQLAHWKTAFPNSHFVVLAEAAYQHADAWNARGGGYANTVSPESWKLFESRLRAAQKLLDSAPAEAKKTPLWHSVAFDVALDSRSNKKKIAPVFKAAVTQWPRQFDFYSTAASRLTPKWGGSWEVVEAFIDHWSKQQQATEGLSMYARLYIDLREYALPSDTKMSWQRMRASLEDLVARYPDPQFKNFYAAYTCFARDKPAYAKAISQLPKEQLRVNLWLPGNSYDVCTLWASK
ncbi:DUF4034 domain-containing protein [Polaromonas sp. P5_D5]